MRKSRLPHQVTKIITDDAEIKNALKAIKEGRKEFKEGKTIKADSLADILSQNRQPRYL